MSWLTKAITNGVGAKTIASKFKRLKFFHGMLLTEHDFLEEQTYFREKIKLHNRLHGYGVVWGLSLRERLKSKRECASDAEENETAVPLVTIEAGFALDCNGNEILVCTDYDVSLEDEIRDIERKGHAGDCESERPPALYIGVRYCECESEPAEQYASSCNGDASHPQYSRIREGFCVVVFSEEDVSECMEPSGHVTDDCHCLPGTSHCPGSRACADEHTVLLGYVIIRGDREERRRITSGKIKPIVRGVSPMSYRKWEEARRHLIQTVCCRGENRYDLSFVIGRSVAVARSILEDDLNIRASQMRISDLSSDDMARVQGADPCYGEESYVDLITEDEEGGDARVLFAVPSAR